MDTQVLPCMSHVTRHTSRVTRHTSRVTRHASRVTRHTSRVTLHASLVMYRITRHSSPHCTCRCWLVLRARQQGSPSVISNKVHQVSSADAIVSFADAANATFMYALPSPPLVYCDVFPPVFFCDILSMYRRAAAAGWAGAGDALKRLGA